MCGWAETGKGRGWEARNKGGREIGRDGNQSERGNKKRQDRG